MIEINGVKLDYDSKTRGEFAVIEKKAADSWMFLNKRHGLEKGNKLSMKLLDKYKYKKVISTDSGDHKTSVLAHPAAIQISFVSEINYKGTNYEVRYFDTKKKNKDGEYVYKPTGTFLRSDKAFSYTDKDLIIFLYLFSGLVKSKPSSTPFTVSKAKGKYYFDDKLVTARNKIEERNRIAKATVTLAELDDEKVRRYASIINIPDYETAHIDILREHVISNIEKDKGTKVYDSLMNFKEKYNDSLFQIEEDVHTASIKKILRQFRVKHNKIPYVEWYYMRGGSKEALIFDYQGSKTSLDNVVNYMAANTEAYELLRDKLNEISNSE